MTYEKCYFFVVKIFVQSIFRFVCAVSLLKAAVLLKAHQCSAGHIK